MHRIDTDVRNLLGDRPTLAFTVFHLRLHMLVICAVFCDFLLAKR